MSQAKSGDKVRIHYTGTLGDGTQFDSSVGKDPLEFELGSRQVIPGFDKAVEGMTVGNRISVSIEPQEAYGEKHEQLIQEVPKSALPQDMAPEVGMRLQSEAPDGQLMHMVITAVTAESVTVDANHPLAGHTLNFEIDLVEIV